MKHTPGPAKPSLPVKSTLDARVSAVYRGLLETDGVVEL
jgi:hypothetical protein